MISDDVFSTMYPLQPDRSAFPKNTPLAMAYVPMQEITTVYEPETALMAGTLFPDLDKPFLAGRR